MAFSTFLVDLDDTVYPASSGVFRLIRQRIVQYMVEEMKIPAEEAQELRLRLYTTYGTTLRGLSIERGVNMDEYLAYVHDVPLKDVLQPDPLLRQVLQKYPQRKIIFTSADTAHAQRVLSAMELQDCFEEIIDVHSITPFSKFQPESFELVLNKIGEKAENCVMIDDMEKTLSIARALGLYTVQVNNGKSTSSVHPLIEKLSDLPSVLE